MFLDYRAPLAIFSWWFALTSVPEIINQEVICTGWYRRGPAPYFELREIRYGATVKRAWVYPAKLWFAGALIAGGFMATMFGFLASMSVH